MIVEACALVRYWGPTSKSIFKFMFYTADIVLIYISS